MSSSYNTQAGNFFGGSNSGVDPRTGLYEFSIPFCHIVGNNRMGPSLTLALNYSPTDDINQGFGRGFSLGQSCFDSNSSDLLLNTGEKYKVYSCTDYVRQKKLDNFRFKFSKDQNNLNGYDIIYKNGISEHLSLIGNGIYAVDTITSPIGKILKLNWEYTGDGIRLRKVLDENQILCTFEYTSSAYFTAWPGSPETF